MTASSAAAPGGAAQAGWPATGTPEALRHFEPGHAAALQRLRAVRPGEYARSRNALDGAVTGLSPYFTHGVLGQREALALLHRRQPLGWHDKLVFEFAWRAFFQHVWAQAADDGDAILSDLRAPATGAAVAYRSELPADIREGRTGVPAIDTAVRVLYASGYLHNHARMWLASYVVHLRKVHWRAGADWLYGHLLDGDLASNHLSWQWVAGTFSSKPYLFNAENVARFAPAGAQAAWRSPGTAIDRTYEALDLWAREAGDCGPEPGRHAAVEEPPLSAAPPADAIAGLTRTTDAAAYRARDVDIVHPWDLRPRGAGPAGPGSRGDAAWRLGLIHLPAHAAWPWSERRWRWVLASMAAVCDAVHVGDAAAIDLAAARSVQAAHTRFPGYREWLAAHAQARPARIAWREPPGACSSFSRYYAEVQRQSPSLADTLGLPGSSNASFTA